MPIKKWLVVVVCSVFWVPEVLADSHQKPGLELTVTNAYMPAVPPVSRTAAIYLTLENKSQSKIILSGISTPIAQHAMIHQTIESEGLVKMKYLSTIEILPGAKIEFSPGGIHIMLMGLQSKSIQETFMLNLMFEKQASQAIKVSVRSLSNQ